MNDFLKMWAESARFKEEVIAVIGILFCLLDFVALIIGMYYIRALTVPACISLAMHICGMSYFIYTV